METERYLDVNKSFIISSPAGSGKTEKLARRYIALLDSGAETERILAITFTEKAASEMKARILHILSAEKPELYAKIRPKIPLMRISTIHAFCLRLLKRFSVDLGLDPRLDVMDEGVSAGIWKESVVECLRRERDRQGLFFEAMKAKGIRGWDSMLAHLDELFRKRPLSEMVLAETLEKGPEEMQLLGLFLECLNAYKLRKAEARLLDFSDFEVLAHRALLKSPEWQNILYTFDEHTDHILVDEFQDTSALQWRLLDILTEEWRSGIGAKRDSGVIPTIFLVGDEKQSIYFFRGADVSVVKKAKERLSNFLGPEYEYQEIKDNYRSLPGIVEFTNKLFEKLMVGDEEKSWKVSYAPFEAAREGAGEVELLLLRDQAAQHTKEKRDYEAYILAKHIKNLRRKHQVYADKKNLRPCDYSDMAVLLRQRTHLSAYEEALRKENIPFIVVKGMGFYEEPEVALLREFISFIVDRDDDYSLFCLLRSPLFGISYDVLSKLISQKTGTLLDEIRSKTNKSRRSTALSVAVTILDGLLGKSREVSLSMLLEEFLVKTSGWAHFREKPKHANIKKFISIIEGLQSTGMDPVSIRDKLLEERFNSDIPKANVNTEGMDAVKLMTVHAAKGLQFPMVFIPSLDEDTDPKTSAIVIEETQAGFTIRYEPESSQRKGIGEFERFIEREREEEKRLFYVAITRAMDYLCLSGFDDAKAKGRLKYIRDSFDLEAPSALPFKLLNAKDILSRFDENPRIELASEAHFLNEPVYTEPLKFEPALHHRDVTEDILVKTRHGKDWVAIGRIMHQLLEEFSKGLLTEERILHRAKLIIAGETFEPDKRERFLKIISGDLQKLKKGKFFKEIILPGENSHAEFPFIHQRGNTIYSGRIDRLIIRGGEALIYDYKSFPVKKNSELDELVDKYRFQMELYREAVEKLFQLPAMAFLVFTHLPLSVEVLDKED